MLTLKRTTLGLALAGVVLLALAGVVLLGLAAPARADEGAAPSTGVPQSTATAEQRVLATAAPPSVSSSAEGAARALPAASGQPAQAKPESAASGPSLGAQSPPPPPQASGTDISQAVEEAIGQASTKQSQEATRGEQGSVAAASNATAQLIWQVEISQCTSDCSGTKQYQSAEQQNTTRQQITTAPAPGGDPRAPVTGERSQTTKSVTQIQYGCLSYCFGTTTTRQPPLAPYGQVLDELLRQITTALSGLSPAPAAEQSAALQVSLQSQNAADGELTQAQSAVQSATTIQSYSTTPIAGPAPQIGGPQAPDGELVNQTEQGIWQLQIGCLFLCHETAQYQQAEQSNATLQSIVSAPGSAASPSASATDIVTQVIWQVQIGCLFWCFDATEQQTVATRDYLTVTHGEGAPAPPALESSSISSGTENEAAPRPGAAGSQAPPGSQPPAGAQPPGWTQPPAGAQPAPGAQPPPEAHALPDVQALPPAGPQGSTGARLPMLSSSTVRVREHVAMPSEASGFVTRGAHVRHDAGVHVAARRLPRPLGAAAAGGAFASPERTSPWPVGVLLAVIALCGVGCLPIAVVRTRRGSRASHQAG